MTTHLAAAIAPRVMLATKFPEQFIRETIEPGLRAIGLDVTRTVSVDFEGALKDCDVIAFMFQYCSHSSYDNFKHRAKQAGIPFMLLSRKQSDWPTAFRMAGVNLAPRAPVVISGKTPVPPALPSKPPPPKHATFGAALRAARKDEDVTQAFVAEMCGVSDGLITSWESDRVPVALDCYEKLVELFPALELAPSPEIARKKAHPALQGTPEPPPLSPVLVPVPVALKTPHRHMLPLDGLRLAARALRITGPVVVKIDDGATDVVVGAETWTKPAPDDAVEAARAALDDRLRDLLDQIAAARQSLGGAA